MSREKFTEITKLQQSKEQERVNFAQRFAKDQAKFKLERLKLEQQIEQDRARFEKCIGQEKTKLQQERARFEEERAKFEKCKDHGRDASMYCQSSECEKSICQMCVLNAHRNHDVVDIVQDQLEKSKTITSTAESLANDLRAVKEKMLTPQKNLESKYNECKDDLLKSKERELKRIEECFDVLVEEASQLCNEMTENIGQEITEVDTKLDQIDDMCQNTSPETPRSELIARLKNLEDLRSEVDLKFSKVRIYKYFTHDKPATSEDGLKMFCGHLEKNEPVHLKKW